MERSYLEVARNEAVLNPESGMPTRLSVLWLELRIHLLRLRRFALNVSSPVPLLAKEDLPSDWVAVASSRTPLRGVSSEVERGLETGKIQNLRVAARALDGLGIPAGSVFSFWRQVGRCSRSKGYVAGRQLQEGCLVRAVGGGICQLTNALYEVAVRSGSEIVERHPHTRIVPGSAAERDMDATVAWNHIDLRFRAAADLRLRVRLTADFLEVSLFGVAKSPSSAILAPRVGTSRATTTFQPKTRSPLRTLIDPVAHGCGACDQVSCHLHSRGATVTKAERAAVMVDEYWPEFEAYLLGERGWEDALFVPSRRIKREAYPWTLAGWSEIRDALPVAVRRSFVSRRLAAQGAVRQAARLESFERLARAYARRLSPDVEHLTVTLDLLPFLWHDGHLGGRTFDVLMTRHPIDELQARLDAAVAAQPERKLLGDFRAPASLVRLEREALLSARRLVTPHSDVVRGDRRRVRIPWVMPSVCPPPTPSPGVGGGGSGVIAFCGPTVARKGAYEVREAALSLGLSVVRMGSDLEGPDFWAGIDVRRPSPGVSWLNGVSIVVQPAVLEDRPRRLLEAIAAGVPVIATPACGVEGLPGVTTVQVGDVEALVAAIDLIGPIGRIGPIRPIE